MKKFVIIFKKWTQPPSSGNFKDPSFDYTAEIYVMPFENMVKNIVFF